MSELISTKTLGIHPKAIQLAKSYEKYEPKPYQGKADRKGTITIGFGHVMSRKEKSTDTIYIYGVAHKASAGLTRKQADDLFLQDMEKRLPRLRRKIPYVQNENQWAAWLVLFYNIEEPADTSPGRAWRAGNYKQAFINFTKYRRSNGEIQRGLIRRRWSEVLLGVSGEVFRANSDQTEKELQQKLKKLGFQFSMPPGI